MPDPQRGAATGRVTDSTSTTTSSLWPMDGLQGLLSRRRRQATKQTRPLSRPEPGSRWAGSSPNVSLRATPCLVERHQPDVRLVLAIDPGEPAAVARGREAVDPVAGRCGVEEL